MAPLAVTVYHTNMLIIEDEACGNSLYYLFNFPVSLKLFSYELNCVPPQTLSTAE